MRKAGPLPPRLPSEALAIVPGQVFGLAGSDLLARLPESVRIQCPVGFRTCLPLRGSSGFSPDSLFTLRGRDLGMDSLYVVGARPTSPYVVDIRVESRREAWCAHQYASGRYVRLASTRESHGTMRLLDWLLKGQVDGKRANRQLSGFHRFRSSHTRSGSIAAIIHAQS